MKPKEVGPRILRGPYITAADAVELEARGVTDVLNLDIPYQQPEVLSATRMRFHAVFLHDMAPLSARDATAVLDAFHAILRPAETKLYVHCNAGVSRSPTAIWLYLVSTSVAPDAAARIVEPDGILLTPEVVALAERYSSRELD